MSVKVVSTFPIDHAPIYGERFLQGCQRFEVPLTLVCYEPFDSVTSYGEARLDATRGGLHDDVELWRWREQTAHINDGNDYRHQMRRFAWKVFAMTRLDLRSEDWLVWLDADVEVTAEPDWRILRSMVDVCYLGRQDWDHSECGFVGWNLCARGGQGLDELRRVYVSGDILKAEQRHDSWIFDRVREKLDLIGLSLSPGARGLDAWEASPLANWSKHHKGMAKFNGAFAIHA